MIFGFLSRLWLWAENMAKSSFLPGKNLNLRAGKAFGSAVIYEYLP